MLFQKGLVDFFFNKRMANLKKNLFSNNGIKQIVIRLIITFNKTKGHAIDTTINPFLHQSRLALLFMGQLVWKLKKNWEIDADIYTYFYTGFHFLCIYIL
jgi:hypothetical protein